MISIPFNKPFLTGKETEYISQAVASGKVSGDGQFTKLCHSFFEDRYGFKKCLLTTSCTDALEMAAILLDIQPGDEVIVPSYTFVSSCNAFVLRGARIVFVDSYSDHPNLDPSGIEKLITSKTRAIVVVHYGGVACDMDVVLDIANRNHLYVIEDAAQAIDSFYKGRPLGGIGHLSAFSFHETKNVISGEGGMLVINDERFVERAEIIREKGTNRSKFFRGEVDKYGWVDIGSSFLPSDIIAAFLYAQLENLDLIQDKRKEIWNEYYRTLIELEEAGHVALPKIPEYATNNAHVFYLLCADAEARARLIAFLRDNGVQAVFHYLSLHESEYYRSMYSGDALPSSHRFTEQLLRLPLYFQLEPQQARLIGSLVNEFYRRNEGV